LKPNSIFKRHTTLKYDLREFYDELGGSYDALVHSRYRRMLQKFVKDEFRDVALTLDVGCGTGTITSGLDGLKIGLDLSPNLARIAKDKGLEVIIGVAENMPFIDNIFEAIVCTDVLEHLSNPLRALRESVRVLKPDRKILIVTPNPIWAPFIKVADTLKLKVPEATCRYIWPAALGKMLKEVNLTMIKDIGWVFILVWPRQLSLEQVVVAIKKGGSFRRKRCLF